MTDPMSHNSTGMESEDMAESQGSDSMQVEGDGIPMSVLGGKDVKPGDVVRLKIESVDPENGTFTAMIADQKPMGSAISRAASKFEPQMNKEMT